MAIDWVRLLPLEIKSTCMIQEQGKYLNAKKLNIRS